MLAKLGRFRIYDRIAARLSKELGGARVVWDARAGLPTFQLQYTHRVTTVPVFRRHCDVCCSLHPLQQYGFEAAGANETASRNGDGATEQTGCMDEAGMISIVVPFTTAPKGESKRKSTGPPHETIFGKRLWPSIQCSMFRMRRRISELFQSTSSKWASTGG